jgi:hypothetical protein
LKEEKKPLLNCKKNKYIILKKKHSNQKLFICHECKKNLSIKDNDEQRRKKKESENCAHIFWHFHALSMFFGFFFSSFHCSIEMKKKKVLKA